MLVEVPECFVVELFPIVRDEDYRHTKAANDTFLDEASNVLLNDGGQRFYLDPFREIVDPYNEELELLHCQYGRGPLCRAPIEQMARERSLG